MKEVNLSQFKKGHIPWNKGKTHMRGKNHPMFGIHRMGEDSPNWKGGKGKHQRGYMLVHMPEHPYCRKDKYVMEHRLVMEKHLGRYLKPTEIVHHLNKIVDDNRIENLNLCGNQKEHLGYHKKEREVVAPCVPSFQE